MNQRQRKSPRLPGYDYTQTGVYFVTICTHQRAWVFGDICQDTMQPSALGEIADTELGALADFWDSVTSEQHIVMPNHVHALIVLSGEPGTKPPTLGSVIGNYKAGVTRTAREQGLLAVDERLWQVRYHDHIVRDEQRLNVIRAYIETNPARWHADTFYGAS